MICACSFETIFVFAEEVSFGTLYKEVLQSNFLGERKLSIYYPDKNKIDQNTVFIIAQDGQYLFDGEINWVKEEWGIDETLQSLHEKNRLPNVVIIGG